MADKIIPAVTVKEPFIDQVDTADRITIHFTWQKDTRLNGTTFHRKEVRLEIQHENGTMSFASDIGDDIPDTVKNKAKAAAEEYLAAVKTRMGF